MHRSLTISRKVLYIAVLFLLLPSRSKCKCQQGTPGIFNPNFQLHLFGNLYRYVGTHDEEINAGCFILPNDLFVDHHNISVSFQMLWKYIEISLHRRVIPDLGYLVINYWFVSKWQVLAYYHVTLSDQTISHTSIFYCILKIGSIIFSLFTSEWYGYTTLKKWHSRVFIIYAQCAYST